MRIQIDRPEAGEWKSSRREARRSLTIAEDDPAGDRAFSRPRGAAMLKLNRQAEVRNTLGLHLRAADQFVRLARQFRSEIRVSCGDKQVDGKSILELTTLAAECGTRLRLEASGPDASTAIDALEGLIDAGFYEAAEEVGHTPPLSMATRPEEVLPTRAGGDDRGRAAHPA